MNKTRHAATWFAGLAVVSSFFIGAAGATTQADSGWGGTRSVTLADSGWGGTSVTPASDSGWGGTR